MRTFKKKGLAVLLLAAGMGAIQASAINSLAAEEQVSELTIELEEERELLNQEEMESEQEETELLINMETSIETEELLLDDSQNTQLVPEIEQEMEKEKRKIESEDVQTGNCGVEEGTVFWHLREDGTFLIYGTGEMISWKNQEEVPWNKIRENITKIEVAEGVTSIGAFAFSNCENVISIELPDSVREIGCYAFFNCNGISTMSIG